MKDPVLLLAAALLLAASQGAAAAAGTWTTLPDMPVPLGEVAAGLVPSKQGALTLVVVGEGSPATLLYDTAAKNWSQGAPRPHVGHHIGAEVIGGRLYLFGGLRQGGDKVQIYDADSDRWSLGADLPYEVGSAATAHIGAYVFLCGGILRSTDDTTDRCIRYDVARNAWEEGMVAPMPVGVNHAAAATDGQVLYVAGGRAGGNRPSAGFDHLQIYDPASNTWSEGPALPQGRGGTGRAVLVAGKLLVLGGETDQKGPVPEAGLTAARVYSRVDVLDLKSQQWTQEAPMPVPRHGIFPVADQESVYVVGGGVRAGNSQSNHSDVLRLPPQEPAPGPSLALQQGPSPARAAPAPRVAVVTATAGCRSIEPPFSCVLLPVMLLLLALAR